MSNVERLIERGDDLRVFKSYDEQARGWYYGDSKDRRVSPTYEHEGVLDKWAELNGVRQIFNVVIQSSEGEQIIGPYADYETADLRRSIELRSRSKKIEVSVREETVISIREAP
jgi:hypothetical protein